MHSLTSTPKHRNWQISQLRCGWLLFKRNIYSQNSLSKVGDQHAQKGWNFASILILDMIKGSKEQGLLEDLTAFSAATGVLGCCRLPWCCKLPWMLLGAFAASFAWICVYIHLDEVTGKLAETRSAFHTQSYKSESQIRKKELQRMLYLPCGFLVNPLPSSPQRTRHLSWASLRFEKQVSYERSSTIRWHFQILFASICCDRCRNYRQFKWTCGLK